MGGALARPSWLSSPTLGRANRFLSTAAVSLMTPRRPLSQPEKVKVRTLAVEQRTEEDSEYNSLCYRTHCHQPRLLRASPAFENTKQVYVPVRGAPCWQQEVSDLSGSLLLQAS